VYFREFFNREVLRDSIIIISRLKRSAYVNVYRRWSAEDMEHLERSIFDHFRRQLDAISSG